MAGDTAALTVLGTTACLALLRSAEVGRLGMCVAGRPEIFPINFAVVEDQLVFATAEGTKLAAAFVSGTVAFEVDGEDPSTGDAWSVVVKGPVQEIPMHDLLDETAFPLFPWSATPKSRFLRVVPEEISGRRFHVVRRRPRDTAAAAD